MMSAITCTSINSIHDLCLGITSSNESESFFESAVTSQLCHSCESSSGPRTRGAHLHITVISVKTLHTHGIVISVKSSQNLT